MPASKISQLPTTTVLVSGDLIPVVAVTGTPTTKAITKANLQAALSAKLVSVADDTARFALTTSDVNVGDLVAVAAAGYGSAEAVYSVIDTGNLDSNTGYAILGVPTGANLTLGEMNFDSGAITSDGGGNLSANTLALNLHGGQSLTINGNAFSFINDDGSFSFANGAFTGNYEGGLVCNYITAQLGGGQGSIMGNAVSFDGGAIHTDGSSGVFTVNGIFANSNNVGIGYDTADNLIGYIGTIAGIGTDGRVFGTMYFDNATITSDGTGNLGVLGLTVNGGTLNNAATDANFTSDAPSGGLFSAAMGVQYAPSGGDAILSLIAPIFHAAGLHLVGDGGDGFTWDILAFNGYAQGSLLFTPDGGSTVPLAVNSGGVFVLGLNVNENASVDGSGNITAVSFTGTGSGLTNLRSDDSYADGAITPTGFITLYDATGTKYQIPALAA